MCAKCGFSFVNERSKPLSRRLLVSCLVVCVASLGLCIAGLADNENVSAASVIGVSLVHALFIQYYALRLAGKEAGLGPGVRTAAGEQGWVATDAFPLFVLWLFPLAAWFPRHSS